MILMKEYVSSFTMIIAMIVKRKKNASLGNSMLNHPGHDKKYCYEAICEKKDVAV